MHQKHQSNLIFFFLFQLDFVSLTFLFYLGIIIFMALDIGTMIFIDILGMSQYPGSPFSGQIINDLVMFLFIPTVFIIVVIYTLVGRLTDSSRIKLLLSIAFYLFIIFGGYYSMFALLAGPYFLFLLIIMGLVFFFFGHFGLRRGGESTQSSGMPGRALMAAGSPAGEKIIRYERLLSDLGKGEEELRNLKEESKANPALHRAVETQQKAVLALRGEVRDMALEINKMKVGYDAKAHLKELERRLGIKE
jgi:hypothetical protein